MGRKVVVAVDKSPEAHKLLAWAAKKILTKEDHVVALYCTPVKAMFSFGGITLEQYWGRIQKEELDIAEKTLRDMRVAAEKIGINISTETQPGHANEVIVDYCKKVKADLLVMGREGHQPIFGGSSVSAHCIAHASCPVLVARQGTYEL